MPVFEVRPSSLAGEPNRAPDGLAFDERHVLGEVEVDGFVYRFHRSGASEHLVERLVDRSCVGRLRGSPSSMWLLEAEGIEEDLLHIIVQCAIEEGFFADLPTD